MNSKPVFKYSTLLSLYLAQSIPMSFFSTVVPVIMRQQNYSLESIGLLQLVKLPWIAKFLWAPIIDKNSSNLKQYRKWMLLSELFYAIIIVSIGFLNLEADFRTIVILMIIAFTASATQDIATDAFAILSLKKEERSFGNSMQSAGSFLGTLVGSGVLLVIYHHYGWRMLLIALAAFVLLALIPLYAIKANGSTENRKRNTPPIKFNDIALCFSQPIMRKRIFILLFFYSGIIGVLTMLKPFMVDLKYNTQQIGLISGIYGTALASGSAVLAGFIIKKLGRRFSMRLFAGLGIVATSVMLLLTHISPAMWHIFAGVGLIWMTYGMSSVLIYTISMDIVRPGREGTDFTIQIVLTHLSSLVIAVSSGKIADVITYKGLFGIELLVSILVFIFLPLLYSENKTVNK